MSVYKRDYRAYTGRLTPLWARVVVLVRYGLAEVWASKIALGLLAISLLPIVVWLIQIYLANNPAASALVLRGRSNFLDIDASFFLRVLETQCWFALPVTAWIAPRLISYDLADNALPILLSHPVSRFGYVLGKFLALASVLSVITWLPGLALFVYQSYSAPQPWALANLRIAIGIVVSAGIWVALFSLIGLALSSWVKWRIVATGVIVAAVPVPAAIGGIVSAVLRTKWGFLLNIPVMLSELWERLLGTGEYLRFGRGDGALPTASIVFMLLLACALCLAMLNARIRAREVVRG